MKQLYVVQIDNCKRCPKNAEQYLQAGRQFDLHSGGRGNGAQGGLYTKEQLNRIIGRYPEGVAKAIPVAFGFTQERVDGFCEDSDMLVALEDAGVDNWSGYGDAMESYQHRMEARNE